jgi:hypothetical protein
MQSTDFFVTVEYTPLLSSGDLPRNNLQARDDSVQPSLRYPYSGQAFDGEQGRAASRSFELKSFVQSLRVYSLPGASWRICNLDVSIQNASERMYSLL